MANVVIQGFPNNGAYTRSDILGYKSYVAKFSQSGTNEPVVEVLYNDTGITVSWERLGIGMYVGNFSSSVSASNFVIPGSFDYQGLSTMLMTLGNPTVQGSMMYYELGNGIEIDTFDTMGGFEEYSTVAGNSIYNVEFRIYN
jgi:hypothetical protein